MTKTITLIYISLSGNTKSFVARLTNYLQSKTDLTIHSVNVKDLVKRSVRLFCPIWIILLLSYQPILKVGNGLDSGDIEILTTPTRVHSFADNYRYCYGIVGSEAIKF